MDCTTTAPVKQPPHAGNPAVDDEHEVEDWDDDENDDPALPPTWDDSAFTVGPRDEHEHRQVQVEIGDEVHEARLFFTPKRIYGLERWLAKAGGESGIPITFDTQRRPNIPGFVFATIFRLAKEADCRAAQAVDVPTFSFTSVADLCNRPAEVEPLVGGLLYRGLLTILLGELKALKTTFAIAMGLAIVSGCLFLGRFPIRRRVPCGFMSDETEADVFAKTASRQATAMGLIIEDLRSFVHCSALPNFMRQDHLRAFGDAIDRSGLHGGVLFLDSIFTGLRDMPLTNVFTAGSMYIDVAGVCLEHGVTPVFITHVKRSVRKGALIAPADAVGAGCGESMRSWMGLSRARPFAHDGKHSLHLIAGSSIGTSSQWRLEVDEGAGVASKWEVTCEPAGQQDIQERPAGRSTDRHNRVKADALAILSAMRSFPDGETASVIRTAAGGMPHARFQAGISALLRREKIIECKIAKPQVRKKAFDGYKRTPNKELSGRAVG